MKDLLITLTDEEYQKILEVAAFECRTVAEVLKIAIIEYIGGA